MKRLIGILAAVLGIQLILAVALNLGGSGFASVKPGQPLLAFDPMQVDRLVIEQPKAKPLTVVKKDGLWRLPDSFGFPANAAKIEALTNKLASLKPHMPVATTTDAAKRFKTSADNYERRISLEHGGSALGTLYLGESAGARRAYARVDGKPAVYEAAIGTWEASTKPDDWVDNGYLHIDDKDVTGLTLGDIQLSRKDGQWQLAGLADGEETNQQAAATLVHRLTALNLTGVLGKEAKPEYRQDKPVVDATLTLQSGKTRHYVISQMAGSKSGYVLKAPQGDYYVQLAGYVVDPLTSTKRDSLVEKKAAPAADAGKPADTRTPINTGKPAGQDAKKSK